MSDELAEICSELQALQRNRAAVIKSRIMAENNRRAFVANLIGYHPGQDEKKRKEVFAEADRIIAAVIEDDAEHPGKMVIRAGELGIAAFVQAQKATEKEMLPLARRTPVAAWVEAPEQKGFGLLSLAVVVGETGDLANYANPAKVWRRLGCAPWTYKDRTQMGATWKGSKPSLPAEEWSAFGYSPRRRSISFLIGQWLKVQNGVGPYRKRFEEAKAQIQAVHPDYSKMRCDRHGMLLATKLLLKNLWKAWNPALDRGEWTGKEEVKAAA